MAEKIEDRRKFPDEYKITELLRATADRLCAIGAPGAKGTAADLRARARWFDAKAAGILKARADEAKK